MAEKFHCDACGVCCKNVNRSNFVHDLDRGDGVCKNLDETTNLCKIYANRPIFCNVDAYYEKNFANVMSREDFYARNYQICAELKKFDSAGKS